MAMWNKDSGLGEALAKEHAGSFLAHLLFQLFYR